MNEPVVRPAAVEDLEGVQAVAVETWRATYRGQIPDEAIENFLEENYNLARLRQILDSTRVGLFVAKIENEVVGYATVGLENGEVFAIYVLPAWQGKGVGSRLWNAATSVLHAVGHAACFLWVLEGNQTARAFYERQGGTVREVREMMIGSVPVSELCYEFQLHDAD